MTSVKSLMMMFVTAAATAVLAAAPGYAQGGTAAPKTPVPQTPAPQTPAPKPAAPPATQTPAAPATQPQPPRPFPEGAKFAFVDIQAIASNSSEGKAATAKLDDLKKKKNAELLTKQN